MLICEIRNEYQAAYLRKTVMQVDIVFVSELQKFQVINQNYVCQRKFKIILGNEKDSGGSLVGRPAASDVTAPLYPMRPDFARHSQFFDLKLNVIY